MSPVFDSRLSTPHSTIYLIRHPAVAVSGLCYGQSEVALAAPVETLAAQLRAQLPTEFTLLSSPLSRCARLAEALGAPRYDARLREIDFGAWELQAWDTIAREQLDAWAANPLDFRAHGGESVRQMAARAVAALDEALTGEARPLVIVGHAGPLRALVGRLQGMPAETWMQLAIGYGELQVFTR